MATGFRLTSYEGNGKDTALYMFENVDGSDLSTAVNAFFNQRGYKLEEGTREDGIYGTGNGILRALLGGFAKRYRFRVKIAGDVRTSRLTISKAMSGAMGGFMGYNRMNKEFERIAEGLKTISAQ
ncbi:MAG: hypothetical protein WC749_03550 [Dehalococcoidia bacterium]